VFSSLTDFNVLIALAKQGYPFRKRIAVPILPFSGRGRRQKEAGTADFSRVALQIAPKGPKPSCLQIGQIAFVAIGLSLKTDV